MTIKKSRLIQAWLERWNHGPASHSALNDIESEFAREHLRIVYAFQLTAIATFFVYSLLFWVLDAPVTASINLFFCVVCSLYLLYLMIKPAYEETQLMMWYVFVSLGSFLQILTTGGLYSPNIVWLMVILIGGFLLLGSQKGIYVSWIILMMLLWIAWLHYTFNNRFYELPFPIGNSVYIVYNLVTAMATVAILTGIYKRYYDKSNAQLRDTEVRAKAAEKVKSSFLANMSHEIRTPLNGILGITELLLDTHETPQQLEKLQILRSSGQQLLALINDILDLSKLEADKMDLESVEFSLRQLLQNYTASQLASAYAKGLKLEYSFEDAIPDLYKGDPVKIEQTLHKFVQNAIQFTVKGKVSIEVYVLQSLSTEPVKLKFVIKDTGVGMDAEKVSQLFSPSQRYDSSCAQQYQGAQLGLAIATKLISLMQGEVGVTSEIGRGSVFWFSVAVGCDEIVTKTAHPGRMVSQNHLSNLQDNNSAFTSKVEAIKQLNPAVLLVEDNKTNQIVALGLLKKIGIHADVANHGEEALRLLEQHTYDVILMDCHMPTMNGYEATQQIRALDTSHQKVPIIAMTANSINSDRAKCLQAGMDDFMSKPIQQNTLLSTLYYWLIKS